MQKPPLLFSFDRVFSPSVPQISFFSSTTLPLVQSLLQGQNGLMFAYGVSNSGKTYTIAGGRDVADERGVLPRSIDVVFNSIKGLEVQQRVSHNHGRTYGAKNFSCAAEAWQMLRFAMRRTSCAPPSVIMLTSLARTRVSTTQ